MALNFNLLAQEGPKNLYEGFEQGRQAVAQNALAQQKLAQEGEMMSMRRQEFQSNLESSQAERRRRATVEKTAMFRDRILRAPTPQAARELVRMQHSDPDLGPVMQQLGSLDQDLADIPDDPTGFESWRQREAMGAAEFIKSQASERGFQDLLARVRGGQQGAAAAPASSEDRLGDFISQIEAKQNAPTPMPAVAGSALSPATNMLAPVTASTNAMAAPAGRGRTPEQIRADIDQFSMSSDPRAARMVQTLTKEYEAALRGDQNRPMAVSPGQVVIDPRTRQPIFTAPDKPATATQLSRLIAERDALPPNSPIRAQYDAAIKKETTQAPGVSITNVGEKAEAGAYGEFLVKDQFKPIYSRADVAKRTLPSIDANLALLNKGLATGFGTDAKAAGARVLGALGVQNAEKYATDTQTFQANAISAVLQKQLEQKGVQTDQDAKRIEQIGAQLGKTKEANEFILSVAREQLKRDIEQSDFYIKWQDRTGSFKGAEQAWAATEGNKSLFDRPALKKYGITSPAAPAASQIPTGAGAAARAPAASTPATSTGNAVTLPDGRVMTFPNADAAAKFRKDAGL